MNNILLTHEPNFFGTIELYGSKYDLYFFDHSINRGRKRHILLNLVPDMIREAAEELLDLKNKNVFIISSEVYITSVVGVLLEYNKIVVITIKDKGHDFKPKNPSDVHIKIS